MPGKLLPKQITPRRFVGYLPVDVFGLLISVVRAVGLSAWGTIFGRVQIPFRIVEAKKCRLLKII